MSAHTAEKDAGGQVARMFAIQAEWDAGETADAGPIRVCCGQRHHGPTCPDGLTMCCVCFKRVTRDRLALLEEGDGSSVESAPICVDMCRTCKEREDRWGAPTPDPGHECTSGDTSGPHRCSCGGWFDAPHQHTRVLPPGEGRA